MLSLYPFAATVRMAGHTWLRHKIGTPLSDQLPAQPLERFPQPQAAVHALAGAGGGFLSCADSGRLHAGQRGAGARGRGAGAVLRGLLQTVESQMPGKSGMHAYSECGFAAAAAPGLPPAAAAMPVFGLARDDGTIPRAAAGAGAAADAAAGTRAAGSTPDCVNP